MAARAFKVVAANYTGTGFVTVATCPASTTWIIKTISARNAGGGSNDFAVGAKAGGVGNPVNWVNRIGSSNLPAGASVAVTGMWAMTAGDTLWVWSGTAFSFDLWISGTKLT